MNPRHSDFASQDLEATLKDLVLKIKTSSDPEELNRIRKVFKKTVPLFMRSYVAAYLLMSQGGFKAPRRKPDATATLFINIGKNRRVFPRDLVQILITSGKIQKHEIGDIKILDKYSFVEVDETKAAQVIAQMNGTLVRGKPVAVNFAKKNEERTSEPRRSPREDSPRRERNSSYQGETEVTAADEDLLESGQESVEDKEE